jgi:hypothetical protein
MRRTPISYPSQEPHYQPVQKPWFNGTYQEFAKASVHFDELMDDLATLVMKRLQQLVDVN